MKHLLTFVLSSLLLVSFSRGQYCDSKGHDNSGDWIEKFRIHNLTNPSGQDANGYGNYTALSDTVLRGGTYEIKTWIGGGYREYVDAWVDFDQNDTFSAGEKILSVHERDSFLTTFKVPNSADTGQTRLRIILNFADQTSDPCVDSLQYGEAEDYTLYVDSNTNAPVAGFIGQPRQVTMCNSSVQFTDTSAYIPTSWEWAFGDGNTSTLENPVNTYPQDTATTYDVQLIASNASGSDTITKNNYIEVTDAGPKPRPCKTDTFFEDYEFGVRRVKLNQVDHHSGVDRPYEDFSCTYVDTITAGVKYKMQVQTGRTAEEDVRGWIDFDNDATFDGSSELFFRSDRATYHSKTVKAPQSVTYDTVLRMRINSDWYPYSISPCGSLVYGQGEDYGVVIKENTMPATGDFSATPTVVCYDSVQFQSTTENFPTSWYWEFGDGDTSTQQNPTHYYSDTGYYTVTLVLCNTYGCDTITKNNYIYRDYGAAEPSCIAQTNSAVSGPGIYEVEIWDMEHHSFDAKQEGYLDLACDEQVRLIQGATYDLKVNTSSTDFEHVRAWVDFNNNQVLEHPSEMIFESDSQFIYHRGQVTMANSAVIGQPLRMRVISTVADNNLPNPCDNLTDGQAEDYTVIIESKAQPPIARFEKSFADFCSGKVQFTDNSVNDVDNWKWSFGDGGVSTKQNPTHTYQEPGYYDVELIVFNSFGSDTLRKNVGIFFPYPDFTWSRPTHVDTPIQFQNQSYEFDSSRWFMGDGTIMNGVTHPNYTYNASDKYDVGLYIYNTTYGCEKFVSKTVVVTIVGQQSPSTAGSLHVYPNPTGEELFIESLPFEKQTPVDIRLVTMEGKVVYHQQVDGSVGQRHRVSVRGLAPGTYFLTLQGGHEQRVRKVIITK